MAKYTKVSIWQVAQVGGCRPQTAPAVNEPPETPDTVFPLP
jgi:hypothetical protein